MTQKVIAWDAVYNRPVRTTKSPDDIIPSNNIHTFTDGVSLTDSTTAYPCTNIAVDPIKISAIQKGVNGWVNVDNIGLLVWVTDDANHYLRGDISELSPTETYPVKIVVE